MNKDRFLLLDGVRGIAALFILIRHTSDFWNFGGWCFRSYLAVDLFFLLSGFVIAHAYDQKLETNEISLSQFMVIRLVRLYPMYLLSIAACAGAAFAWFFMGHAAPFMTLHALLISTALSLFYIPSHAVGNSILFPLNTVSWSLAFEVAVNFVYGAIHPHLRKYLLLSIIIVSGVFVALSGQRYGTLDLGWSWDSLKVAAGISRAVFGIFLGVFLFRQRAAISRRIRFVIPYGIPFLVLVGILASPSLGSWDNFLNLLCVFVLFPAIVHCSAALVQTKDSGVIEKLFVVLGTASYPMYLLHVVLGRVVKNSARGSIVHYAPFSGVFLAFGIILISYWLEVKFDLPLRRRLRSLLVRTKVPSTYEVITASHSSTSALT